MRPTKLFETTAFRLTLLFSAVLSASALLLFTFVYWQTAGYLDRRVADFMLREASHIAGLPPERQSQWIADRLARDPRGIAVLGLFDAQGKPLAGNIAVMPPGLVTDGQIRRIPDPRPGPESATVMRVLARPVAGDRILVDGRSVTELEEFEGRLIQAFGWAAGLALAFGLAGGAVLSLGSVRRIEAIHRTTRAIIAGNLKQRLPSRARKDDFDRLADMVNEMLDEMERLMSDVKGVSDAIAHDLRTPLGRLRARLERALAREHDAAEYRAAIEGALETLDDILARFAAMLRLAEIEIGRRREGFARTDLGSIVAAVGEFYEPLAEEKGIALVVRPAAEHVFGDRDLLFEAVSNLVDNAVKFSPPGGAVSLSLGSTPQGPVIEVADEGPGIPPAERTAIFTRFYRADKARGSEGTGLGLTLVAAIARLHGFSIEIPETPRGLTIRICCWPGAAPSRDPLPAPARAAAGASAAVHP